MDPATPSTSPLHVLLIGSGGREHALAWKLRQSPRLGGLWCAPGNAGTAQLAENVDLNTASHDAVIEFCRAHDIGLVVVGPEQPLVDGLADALFAASIPVFGPMREAAKLEGSKEFAKSFMRRFGIPTADSRTYSLEQTDLLLRELDEEGRFPVVLKADGLAAGKGVIICGEREEAEEAVRRFAEEPGLQAAAGRILVEEFMEGEEASVFVISDGHTSHVLHVAQDHKRIGDGDTGPNTGGMGAYCPAPVVTPELMARIDRDIVQPTIAGMQVTGCPYTGVLYIGLMLTAEGPKVVEYNCRFGDPECQCILPVLRNDLLELLLATTDESLDRHRIDLSPMSSCCVVMASEGYPGSYRKGLPIRGLEPPATSSTESTDFEATGQALVFHAGTRLEGDEVVTSGGRVLGVVGVGRTLQDAIETAYARVEAISFDGAVFRRDIGHRGLARLG